jgi:hypothetical protein
VAVQQAGQLTPAAAPGLWEDTTWNGRSPGSFAIVIGVSVYPYLDGTKNSKPVAKRLGLGQLPVSALTAYRYFEWLQTRYMNFAAPLRRCWLLLAPSAREVGLESGLQTIHTQQPNFMNLCAAIGDWYETMVHLPGKAASSSSSLFVFVGHGVVFGEHHQFLLPADYLGAGAHDNYNIAISTENVKEALKPIGVGNQHFFLDACRNDCNELKKELSFDPQGFKCLSPAHPKPWKPRKPGRRPTPAQNIFYATCSEKSAYQPPGPREELSIHGRAVLDGLKLGGAVPDTSSKPWVIRTYALQRHVEEQVLSSLAHYPGKSDSTAMLGGERFGDPTITEVVPPTLPGQTPPPEPPAPPGLGLRRWISRIPNPFWRRPAARDQVDPMPFFGSAFVSGVVWPSIEVKELRDGETLRAADEFRVHRVESDQIEAPQRLRITFSLLDQSGPHWVQLSDGERTYAVVLPRAAEPPLFVLEIGVVEGRGPLGYVEVTLSPENEGALGNAARLWHHYRAANLSAAQAALPSIEDLTSAARGDLSAGLAATLTGFLLLTYGRVELLGDWTTVLADGYGTPDARVLRIQHALAVDDQPSGETLRRLVELEEVELPHTTEALACAADQAEKFRRLEPPESLGGRSVDHLADRFTDALRAQRVGGMFAVYEGGVGEIRPTLAMSELVAPKARRLSELVTS